MQTYIEGQHTEIPPALRAWISTRVEELNTPHNDILHMRVRLEKNQHHARGNDEARVVCTLPGYTLHTTKTGTTLDEAAIAALTAMERELQQARTRRYEVVKTPNPRPRGRIVRLFTDRGYGFIETEARREVYFHAHAVQGIAFADLAVGMVVDLDIEAGRQGPQASRVTPRR